MSLRPIKQVLETKPTIEGAGVKLQRAFGFGKTKDFDPFLLLDDFRNENSGCRRNRMEANPRHRRRVSVLLFVSVKQVAYVRGTLHANGARSRH